MSDNGGLNQNGARDSGSILLIKRFVDTCSDLTGNTTRKKKKKTTDLTNLSPPFLVFLFDLNGFNSISLFKEH